jgi:hypothetical protein
VQVIKAIRRQYKLGGVGGIYGFIQPNSEYIYL